MPNYTKLFNSIVTSTIWTEDDKTRIVWITMLALADQNGEVHASIPGLARLAGVPLSDVESAISKFLGPDQYSRTPANDGRRIAAIDGGWELLNHAKYRRMASLADQKDANAKRQKRHRDRNATVTHRNGSVTGSNATVTVETDKAEAEAEAEAEADKDNTPKPDAHASEVLSLWNSRNELAKVRSFTQNRKRAIKARMNDPFFRQNWKEAFQRMLESPFLTGTNDKGWRADFDWFIKPDSVPRIMEGKYDHKAPVKTYSHANGYNESTSIDHL